MIRIRRSEERGHFDFGWLDTRHTFSFGDYHDPEHMGFRHLRVLNEDRVRPGAGFPTHGHRDMEILTYVLAGALEHKDSLGTGSVIRPGDVQRMSAGTGVLHSEFNASKAELLHLLQIWVVPETRGLAPGYEQKHFPEAERRSRLRLVASRDGREGSVSLHQDVDLYAGILERADALDFALRPERNAWVQVAHGELELNGHPLRSGDGAALSDTWHLHLIPRRPVELLLFDLP
ncbi:MAG: pirin family protein [Planctomycetota bacterium]|nr:MAG: pirin family protein [Planctomycetota bacterium]